MISILHPNIISQDLVTQFPGTGHIPHSDFYLLFFIHLNE